MPVDLRAHLEPSRVRDAESVTRAWCQAMFGSGVISIESMSAEAEQFRFRLELDGESLLRVYACDALHKSLLGDRYTYGSFLCQAHAQRAPFSDLCQWSEDSKLSGRCHRYGHEAITYAIDWQIGDIILLDNTHFMHGREAIVDPAQRRILS